MYTVDFHTENSPECGPLPNVSKDDTFPDTPPDGQALPDTPSGGLLPDTPASDLQLDTPPGDLQPDTPPPPSVDTLQTPSANKQPHLSKQTSCQSETQYSKLSDDDKAKVESILYLIDKFGVGDEFMHELSMVVDGMPKSYLFKQCRKDLNMGCIITSTPGRAPGAQYSLKQLLADRIKHMVSTGSTEQVIFFPEFSFFTY